jgi:polysaccharide biosynthesis/export protein
MQQDWRHVLDANELTMLAVKVRSNRRREQAMRAKVALILVVLLGAPRLGWTQADEAGGKNPTIADAKANPTSKTTAASPPEATAKQLNLTPNDIYIIGADDVLHISVWKEPELTTTLPVRSDGQISLPLVNDVQAAGLSPMQLAASLTEKLRRFVDEPRVTVAVAQMNHQRVYVLGEVLRHGPMALTPDMTVLQVLATCGVTQFANTKKIYVLRSINGSQQKLPVNYKRLLKGQSMNQNIVLKEGDTVVVP